MSTEIVVNKPLSEIDEVITVWSHEETNDLIQQGWIVMHAGVAHYTMTGHQAKPCFVLAHMRTK